MENIPHKPRKIGNHGIFSKVTTALPLIKPLAYMYTDGQKKRYIEILQYFWNVLVNIDVFIHSIIIIEGHTILRLNFMKTSFFTLNARATARFARAAIKTTP